MKVALFIPKLDRGGPDRVFYELALALPDHGIEPMVLAQCEGGYYWDRLPATVGRVALGTGSDAAKQYPVQAYARAIQAHRPDVVMATLRSLLTAAAARLSGKVRTPLVLRPANHLTRNSLELLKQHPLKHGLSWMSSAVALHAADHLVCQSEDLRADFRRYAIPTARMTIIGNPAPERPPALPRPPAGGIPLFVAAGRLMPQKGFDILIDAVGHLHREGMPLRMRIYGEGPERDALQRRITTLGLDSQVTLEGFSEQLSARIAEADYFVSASRYEGFPNVVLEALSLGIPAVATDCPGGTRQLVVNEVTGWLCAPDSAASLADAMHRAIHAPRPDSLSIQHFIREHFGIAAIASAYATVFRTVAANAARST